MNIDVQPTHQHLIALQRARRSLTVVVKPAGGWTPDGVQRLVGICRTVPRHRFVVVFEEPVVVGRLHTLHNVFAGCVGWAGRKGMYRYQDVEEAYADLCRKASHPTQVGTAKDRE